MTFFAGIMSMPWILDGRHDKLCKFNIVERKDWCNKERDKTLEKCPVASPEIAKICISQIQWVTDPGTMASYISMGMPPFTNPPCLAQGKCEKKSADQVRRRRVKIWCAHIVMMVALVFVCSCTACCFWSLRAA